MSDSPTKSLSTWWNRFKSDEPPPESRPGISRSSASAMDIHDRLDTPAQSVFGVPLLKSLNTASVKIKLQDLNGEPFVYGRIPVVIAKCASYLKQNARETEGIFRIPGSVKRIRVLQELFDTPTDYGLHLDFTNFTQHDAANLLKRYLSQLPDPVIPVKVYNNFRNVIKKEPETQEEIDKALNGFEEQIFALPRSSRQLLLYLIDLMSVFAKQSEQNKMTSFNLSSIFQPNVLTVPEHDMNVEESQHSQRVLQFLTDNSERLLAHVQKRAIEQHTQKKMADDGASDDEEDEVEEEVAGLQTRRKPPALVLSDLSSPEEPRSLFRRSLMVLLPSPTEERPGMKRSGSWFKRD